MITSGDYSLQDKVWDKVSEEAKDLIRSMLEIDPDYRPSAQEVLLHEWFLKDFTYKKVDELSHVINDLDKRKSLKLNG
jgi:serine/threonine protein kinase